MLRRVVGVLSDNKRRSGGGVPPTVELDTMPTIDSDDTTITITGTVTDAIDAGSYDAARLKVRLGSTFSSVKSIDSTSGEFEADFSNPGGGNFTVLATYKNTSNRTGGDSDLLTVVDATTITSVNGYETGTTDPAIDEELIDFEFEFTGTDPISIRPRIVDAGPWLADEVTSAPWITTSYDVGQGPGVLPIEVVYEDNTGTHVAGPFDITIEGEPDEEMDNYVDEIGDQYVDELDNVYVDFVAP